MECLSRELAGPGRAFAAAEIGVPLVVTIAPQTPPRLTASEPSLSRSPVALTSWDVVSDLVVGFLLPAVSLLLGFWVAFRRPRDPLAWLLLAPDVELSTRFANRCCVGLAARLARSRLALRSTPRDRVPIIIFLFGRFFPEPFARGSRYDVVWRALQWLCALPFAMLSLCPESSFRSVG